jgi:transaldolase
MNTFTIDLTTQPVMRIFLDTANVSEVDERIGTGLIDGVTTNPSLILKSGNSPLQVYNELAQKFPQLESISAEVVADDHVDMIKQALDFYTIGNNITIKLPCTPEGLKACAYLSSVGNTDGLRITTNVTLVFSLPQAILAAKAGATYVSPFVGRIYDNSFDGVQFIQNISDTYKLHGVSTKILAASLRDVYSVSRCYMAGADVVTMPAAIFDKMYCHVFTDTGLDTFNKDHQAQQQ